MLNNCLETQLLLNLYRYVYVIENFIVSVIIYHSEVNCPRIICSILFYSIYSMLNFPENERDSRKLKQVQELVQHFREQFKHYVPKENITYKHW